MHIVGDEVGSVGWKPWPRGAMSLRDGERERVSNGVCEQFANM